MLAFGAPRRYTEREMAQTDIRKVFAIDTKLLTQRGRREFAGQSAATL